VDKWKTTGGSEIFRIVGSRCNVYLVKEHDHFLLFDSSMKGERKRLERRVRSLGVTELDALILSHTHFDHAGNAAYIQQVFHTPVHVQKEEAAYLMAGKTPLPGGTTWFTRWLMRVQHKKEIPVFPYQSCKADRIVGNRLELSDLGFDATLLSTPGHSPGSMSLIVKNEIALVGDTMFGQVPGIIFPPFADSADLLIRSWGMLLETSCRLFLPAHGRPVKRSLLEKWYKRKRKREFEDEGMMG